MSLAFSSSFISQIRRLSGLAVITIALVSSGCSKQQKPDDSLASNLSDSSASADANLMGDSDSGKAMGLQTVNFPYDSFVLDGAAKDILKANAEILKGSSSLKVQIEGHCDQRGGIQYNIALGEKRAAAVKKHLEGAGVGADRITTISYGKERLLDSSESEAAYAKNRRANFVITSK